jgi:hypothetical protein
LRSLPFFAAVFLANSANASCIMEPHSHSGE